MREEAGKREFANLRAAYAKAEALPFEEEPFDLVTCRIAPHHFDSILAFPDETRLQEWRDAIAQHGFAIAHAEQLAYG